MKFTIQQFSSQQIQTKYGQKTKYRFTSNGQTYDAWMKSPYTDSFAPGYTFEAELSGKPYKGIDTIAWPKAQTSNVGQSSGQLDRIEAKLDQLIQWASIPKVVVPRGTNVSNMEPGKSEVPYADSPPPTTDDEPGTPF